MAKRVNISVIKPNEENPRFITDQKFKKLVKSIKEFPQMLEVRPLVVDENFMVLGGNMRLKALKSAGVFEVPIQQVKGWTDEQKKEFIIKDNLGYGEWDWDIVANDWDIQKLKDWGMDLPDFPDPELDAEEDDYEEPDDLQVDVVLGDLIEIGEHRLLCGDSTDADQVAKLMDGEKADMVFTDPPYALFGNSTGVAGVTDDKMVMPFFIAVFDMLKKNTKLFGHIYVCCDWHSAFSIEKAYRSVELTAKNLCIWDKGDGGLGAMYQQCYEMVWFLANSPISKKVIGKAGMAGERTVNGKPNIWRYKRETSDRLHTAQKPTEMVAYAIKNSTDKNDYVLDLFLGSGTTMVASNQINRRCFGMEMEPKYCQVIIDRMIKLDPNIEVKINGKKYH